MAKKRGGLAGVWDRNKGVIKAAAPIAAGFIPGVGPMVGAALGAAMGGLDRPGKSGIGLDVGGAVKGGISGYGGAKLGQAAKGGLAKMFTASPLDKLTGAPQVGLTAGGPTSYGAVGSMTPSIGGSAAAMPGPAASASMYGNIPAPSVGAMPKIATQAASPTGGGMGMMDTAKKAGGYFERNQQMLGGVAKGVGSVLGGRAEGDAAANKLALEQSQFDYLKQQNEAEEERKQNVAQLIAQMFAPQMASMYASGRGTPAMTMQDYMQSSGATATPEEFGPEMMNYINSRPTQPSGPSQGLMNYVNSRR